MKAGACVLLDRDGTLIKECHYLSDPDQVELLPGAIEALRNVHRQGFRLLVLTNQSGLARGYFDHNTLAQIHQRLQDLLAEGGVFLDGLFFCPHHPDDRCICRKPGIGLVRQAQDELGMDPSSSVMIGDKACDIGVGEGAGLRTILVRTGYGKKEEKAPGLTADVVVDDLRDAARWLRKTNPDAHQAAAKGPNSAARAHNGTKP